MVLQFNTQTHKTGEVESLLPEESYSERNQNYGTAKTSFDNGV
jgi:hypothetical protein